MEDRTFIKLFRSILTWGWYKDTNTFRVFMHILLKAQYYPSEYKGEQIKAGECVFGRKAWSKELGLSEQQIRTAISHLQSTNEITIRATNRFSIISVVKWDFWQMQNGLSTNESTNDIFETQPTSNQQVTTSKESNKEIINNHSYKKNGMRPKSFYGIPEDQAWTAEEKLAAIREGWK